MSLQKYFPRRDLTLLNPFDVLFVCSIDKRKN